MAAGACVYEGNQAGWQLLHWPVLRPAPSSKPIYFPGGPEGQFQDGCDTDDKNRAETSFIFHSKVKGETK